MRRRLLTMCCIALLALLSFAPLQALENDAAWAAFAGIALIAALVLIALTVASRSIPGAAITLVFLAVAWMLLANDTYPFRERVRWIVFANQYKAAVLSHPPEPRQLQHAVWDEWGWATMDTEAYLVFDPEDTLVAASRHPAPVTALGIPCAVHSIHRLEPHWYSVVSYTDSQWDSCTKADR